jgi:sulfur carrier protein ThiS
MADLTVFTHEPELVEQPAGKVRVLVLRSPFALNREEHHIAEGRTLAAIVADLALEDWTDALVAIDGHVVEPKWWPSVRAKAGHVITIRVIPRGGGGSSGNKGWIQIAAGVLLIAIGVVLIAGGAITFGALAGAGIPLVVMGIGLVAGGALTLIFPPASVPKLKSGAGADAPVFSITGARNTANPYGAIPRVYGAHKIFPPRTEGRA